ncbi:MAG: aminotransferase class V-fold PLP-dependent enzyme [Cyanobacteria bacterium P01_A01_bin.114]
MNNRLDLQAIIQTLQQHRQSIPALSGKLYGNYGGQGPMPQTAVETIYSSHQLIQQKGPFSSAANKWLKQEADLLRQTMATELGTTPESLTLTENVTVGCNIPLWGLPWEAGDRILISDCEHPGIVAAVTEISRRYSVGVDWVSLKPPSRLSPTMAIAQALHPRTKLLVISQVLWNTGQLLPFKDIVNLCCNHAPQPVRILVDAAQSVGMLPLNLDELGADFYVFTGHKWWCGPAGVGGLYVRPDALEAISPTFIGWRGIRVDDEANPIGWQPDGRRFQIATSDGPLWPSLRAAIAFHNQWGTAQQRYFRICQLGIYLWSRLNRLPKIACILKTPPESGLVSFQISPDGTPSPTLHTRLVQYLETQHIYLRTLLLPHCVRACVHYFTLESELDRLVEAIEAFLKDEIG